MYGSRLYRYKHKYKQTNKYAYKYPNKYDVAICIEIWLICRPSVN